MPTDLATLAIQIKTDSVRAAIADLRNLEAAGAGMEGGVRKAATATDQLDNSTKRATASTGQEETAIKRHASATDQLEAAVKRATAAMAGPGFLQDR